jgi:hypothetical protein
MVFLQTKVCQPVDLLSNNIRELECRRSATLMFVGTKVTGANDVPLATTLAQS